MIQVKLNTTTTIHPPTLPTNLPYLPPFAIQASKLESKAKLNYQYIFTERDHPSYQSTGIKKRFRVLELGSRLEMWGKRKRRFEDALVFDFY
jgi:hypothetical protein